MDFVHTNEIVPLSRILFVGVVAFALSMALTPLYTRAAYHFKWWKILRTTATTGEKAPVLAKLHAAKHKRNIPTLGGLVPIAAVAITTLALNYDYKQTLLPLFVLVAAGAVGALDDFINIRGGGGGVAGLRSKMKFSLILGIAVIAALYFYYKLGYSLIHIPAVGDFNIGWFYIPLIIGVIVSTANAVNISDGLDGLAGGLLTMAYGAFGVLAYAQHNYGIAAFCVCVAGAMLTYTWFNIFPARFFMGDTGAFALGTTLGLIAVLTNNIVVLPIIGFVFVIEGGSSAIQILSKKIRKKKIFLSAPIHHHFEAIGWPETKVTMRFWVIGAATGIIGMILGLLGNKAL